MEAPADLPKYGRCGPVFWVCTWEDLRGQGLETRVSEREGPKLQDSP